MHNEARVTCVVHGWLLEMSSNAVEEHLVASASPPSTKLNPHIIVNLNNILHGKRMN